MIALVPFFPGFYNTYLDFSLDNSIENDAEWLTDPENEGFLCDDTQKVKYALWESCDFSKAHEILARGFTATVEREIQKTAPRVTLTYESYDSPREYNFLTDRAFAKISEADVRFIYENTSPESLQAVFTSKFTSRSGFSSHYSPNFEENGHPIGDDTEEGFTWDHNQLGALLEAFMLQNADRPSDLAESMESDAAESYGYRAYYDSLDYKKFEEKMKEDALSAEL